MRSRILHSWLQWFVAACAACSLSVVACSDEDPETAVDPLQGASGSASSARSNGGAAGSAGSGGAPSGGQGGSSGRAAAGSGGAAAGSSAGGSANAGGGAAGAAGAAGNGPDVGGEPDAGEVDPVDGEDEPGDDPLSFAADILPIFAENCDTCHTTQGFAGHNVGGALPGSYNDALELGMTLLTRIDGGGMPQACGQGDPGDPGCLTVEQVELVRTWIAQGSEP